MLTEFITWTANRALYDGFIEIRWYGLFFAIGFIVGYNMMERMFRHEQVNLKWLDSLFIYVVIATVLGARLGHCLFDAVPNNVLYGIDGDLYFIDTQIRLRNRDN